MTAVERNPAMALALRSEAVAAGVEARVVEGSWPG